MTRPFRSLPELARFLRRQLVERRYVLLYAHNGTGKTRLSVEFKNLGKSDDARDTLYFNAFTEDLFYWDNDLESDERRTLKFNINPRFFNGLNDLEMSFHGHRAFGVCVKASRAEDEGLHQRMLNILSHGKYSLYDPREMTDDNKEHFRRMFDDFRATFLFNPTLFPETENRPA